METQVVLCEIQSFQSSKKRLCTLLSYETKQVIDNQPRVIRNSAHPLLHEDGGRRFHQTLTIYQTTWCHNIEDWQLLFCQLSRCTNYAMKHKLQWRTTWPCGTTPVCVCVYLFVRQGAKWTVFHRNTVPEILLPLLRGETNKRFWPASKQLWRWAMFEMSYEQLKNHRHTLITMPGALSQGQRSLDNLTAS